MFRKVYDLDWPSGKLSLIARRPWSQFYLTFGFRIATAIVASFLNRFDCSSKSSMAASGGQDSSLTLPPIRYICLSATFQYASDAA